MPTIPLHRPRVERRPFPLLPGGLLVAATLFAACSPDQVTAPEGPSVLPALPSGHQAPIQWEEQYIRVESSNAVFEGVRPALEPSWSRPLVDLPGRVLSGIARYVGEGCTAAEFASLPAGLILILSADGPCGFDDRVRLAEAAGARGVVIHNTRDRNLGGGPEGVISMPGSGPVGIPAFFVGETVGLAYGATALEFPSITILPPRRYLRLTSSAFPGDQYRALEAGEAFLPSIRTRPGQMLAGEVEYVGGGCASEDFLADPQGKIALMTRSTVGCRFDERFVRAQLAGALGVVFFAPEEAGDSLVIMGGENPVTWNGVEVHLTIPAVYIAHGPGTLLRDAPGPVNVTIAVPGATTPEIVEQVEDVINQLEEDGVLNGGQANSLRSQLEAAKRQISRGNLSAARNILNAFIQHVQGMVAQGTLSAADGALLIALAQSLLASL